MKSKFLLIFVCVVFKSNVRQSAAQGGGLMQGFRDFALLNPVDTSGIDSAQNSSIFPPDAFPPDAFPPDTFPPDAFPPDTFPPDTFPPDSGPQQNLVSPGKPFPPSTPVGKKSAQADTNSPNNKNLRSDSFMSNVQQRDPGLPADTSSATDPGIPLDPLATADSGFPIDSLPQNPGTPVDVSVLTDVLPPTSGVPVDHASGTDPFASEPGTAVDPNVQGDLFVGDPFAGDPFAGDPLGDPFGEDPFAPDTTVSGGGVPTITNDSPLFRFLPSMPTGNEFINLNDGTTNTFQPTENWMGEPLGVAKLEPNALDPTDSVLPGTPVSSTNVQPVVPSMEVGKMPADNTPMSPEVLPGTEQHAHVNQNEVIPVQEGQLTPISLDPIASPDTLNIMPDISAGERNVIPFGPTLDQNVISPGHVVDSNSVPLGPLVDPNQIPFEPTVDSNAIPLGPAVHQNLIPFGPSIDSNAIPLGPAVDQNAISLGPAVDTNLAPFDPTVNSNAVPLGPVVDSNSIPSRPVVDSNAIPLGPIFATPVVLNPTSGGQNQNPDNWPGSSAQVPKKWMQVYTRDRPRPRKNPAVQKKPVEPVQLSPTDNLLAQASINSFTRNRGLYRRLRQERRLARKLKREERKRQKQLKQQQQNQSRQERKQQRNQAQRPNRQNGYGRGRVIVSKGPRGAKVARMVMPGRKRPFVGKNQRGRRMVEPCTWERRRLGLCAPDQLPPGEIQGPGVGQLVNSASGQPSSSPDHIGQSVNSTQTMDPLLGATDHGTQLDSQHEPPLDYRGRGVRNPQDTVITDGSTLQQIGNAQGESPSVGHVQLDTQYEPPVGYDGRRGRNSPSAIQTIGSEQAGIGQGQPLMGITDNGGLPLTHDRQLSPMGQGQSLATIETIDAGQHLSNTEGDPMVGITDQRGQPVTGIQHERPWRKNGRMTRNRRKWLNKEKRQGNARNWRKQRKNKMKVRKGKLLNMRPNMQEVAPDFLPMNNTTGIQHSADIWDPISGIPVGQPHEHGVRINPDPHGILDPSVPNIQHSAHGLEPISRIPVGSGIDQGPFENIEQVMPRNARNRRKQRKNRGKVKQGKLIKRRPNMQNVGQGLLPLEDSTGIQPSTDDVGLFSGPLVVMGMNREPQGMVDPSMPIKGKKLENAQKVIEPLNNVSLNNPDQHTLFDSHVTDMGRNSRKNNKQNINRRGRKKWKKNNKRNRGRKKKGPKIRQPTELIPVDISSGNLGAPLVPSTEKPTTPNPAHLMRIAGLGFIDFGAPVETGFY